MSATVHSGGTVVFVGDSITAAGWYSVSGGLLDQLNAQVTAKARVASCAGGAKVGSVANGAAVGSVAPVTLPIGSVNSGVSGNQTSDIAAAVASRVTNYGPACVVLLVGINDLLNSIAPATTQANYNSILSQIRAWSSTVPIVCVSVLWKGEQWTSPPLVWSNAASGGYDAGIDSLNSTIQSLCATYSATYIDMRSQALLYEQANNTPQPGVAQGILSQDTIHPTIPLGQTQMGNWGIGSFIVVTP